MAEGKTIIENAAKEPHIVDVANMLNSMGADIRGAGTDKIRINGVEKLHGTVYSTIPTRLKQAHLCSSRNRWRDFNYIECYS